MDYYLEFYLGKLILAKSFDALTQELNTITYEKSIIQKMDCRYKPNPHYQKVTRWQYYEALEALTKGHSVGVLKNEYSLKTKFTVMLGTEILCNGFSVRYREDLFDFILKRMEDNLGVSILDENKKRVAMIHSTLLKKCSFLFFDI